MILNNLKIAFRSLAKDKAFTLLNLVGLSAAFSVAILLTIFIIYQLSFDKFHAQVDQLYQVYYDKANENGIESDTSNSEPFAAALQDEVPGVENITRLNGQNMVLSYGDKELQMNIKFVDPSFFEMFSFPILKGNKRSPINEESSIAITEFAAKNIFGTEDPIGKTVSLLRDGEDVPFVVSAIIQDFPDTSSLNFDIVMNFKGQPAHAYERAVGRWDIENHSVYIQLAHGINPERFEESTIAFTDLHYKEEIDALKRDGIQPNANGNYRQIRLLPVVDTRFAKFNQNGVEVSRTLQYLVLGIALLIVIIACVNFVNMSIARSAKRLREIGVRKTLGAGKKQLFFQFWGESILLFLISLILGSLLALLLMEPFQTLFRTRASFDILSNSTNIFSLFFTIGLITLIAGGYPALLMSRLKTLQSLKGNIQITGNHRLRNSLMIFQFSIAILLISGTLVLRSQVDYMRTIDLGYNKNQVIAFPLNGKRNDQQALKLMRDALNQNPNVLSITASNNILGVGKDGARSTSVLGFEYKGRSVSTNMLVVDADYIETLDLELIKGRSFKSVIEDDSLSVIINETMAAQLDEGEIINSKIIIDEKPFNVVGVIKDYNFQDLDRNIESLSLFALPNWNLRNVYVKVSSKDLAASYDLVKEAWAKIEPEAEFQGSFLNENIDRTLRNERTMTTMIGSGSILAIVLSCIGLFAMSLLLVEQRRKEIGIRKVVGASVSTITILLSKDFLKLVAIAFVIATPISWWLSSNWLQNYPYRIDLNIGVFLVAGLIALTIALLTISYRTVKAAIANPVKSLRTE